MAFNAPYEFKVDNTVVIQHRREGNFGNFKSVRVKGDNHHEVTHDGGKGDFAQWHAERDGQHHVYFKSTKGGKYLRIKGDGSVDAGGAKGPWCRFKVHHGQNGIVKLEGTKSGKYLAFRPQAGLTSGTGGDFCKFKIWRNAQGGHQGGGGGGGHFSHRYEFKLSNTVVIQHRHQNSFGNFKTIRVEQNGDGLLTGGGRGDFAQFYVEKKGQNEVQIKSLKTQKFIRIHRVGDRFRADCGGTGGEWCTFTVHHGQGGHVKLKGKKSGKHLAVRDNDGVAVGNGGEHCELKFFRK